MSVLMKEVIGQQAKEVEWCSDEIEKHEQIVSSLYKKSRKPLQRIQLNPLRPNINQVVLDWFKDGGRAEVTIYSANKTHSNNGNAFRWKDFEYCSSLNRLQPSL